jgi:thiamine-monophosphate kinase
MTARPTDDPDLTVAQIGEFGLIDRLARLLNTAGRDPLRPEATGAIGIGDDAALWEPTPGHREVLTTDALIEDVHFRHRTTSWRDLGWKALAENVSDIAAMGATPARAFVTLGLRPDARVADLEELYRGMAEIAAAYQFAIVGGDTVSSPVTMLSITVIGDLQGEGLRRAAGRRGDTLAVTGTLGGSAGGLALLESGALVLDDPDVARLVTLHTRPQPRVREGLTIAEVGVRCGMDLSDGLLGDAGKLAYASGLRAVLRPDLLPLPPDLACRFGDDEARRMSLRGGEDYELLVAGEAEAIAAASLLLRERGLEPLTPVGHLEAGRPGQVRLLDQQNRPLTAPPGSWDHFRQSETTS